MIDSVPIHIPVLLIANFRDVQADWKISSDELKKLISQYCIRESNEEKKEEEEEEIDNCSMNSMISEENQFSTLMSEVYSGKRRVIKYVETSFLEKFGLHVLYWLFLSTIVFIYVFSRTFLFLTINSVTRSYICMFIRIIIDK